MIEDPEVYYSCSDCVLSFVKKASNGVYVEATTDHARCSTCGAKATFVCMCEMCEWSKKQPAPKESCPRCYYMTVTEETLFKAREAIMKVLPFEESAHAIINELLNSGLLIRERI